MSNYRISIKLSIAALFFVWTAIGLTNNSIVSYSITSETFKNPTPRTRKKIGVAEDVTLTFSPAQAASWVITSGGGTLTPDPGQVITSTMSVKFTAPDTPSTTTVTATRVAGSGGTATITFTTVKPDGVVMEHKATNISDKTPFLRLGMTTDVYITPNDVNFEKISIQEDTVGAQCTGYFDHESAFMHPATGGWVPLTSHVAGKGTKLAVADQVTGVTDSPNHPASYSDGTFLWEIPWKYNSNGDKGVFKTVNQRKTLTMNGLNATLKLEKAGATVSLTAP